MLDQNFTSLAKVFHPLIIIYATLQEENSHWNLSFAFSLLANSLSFNSAYYYIYGHLSMTGYIIGIKKHKLANI